MSTAFMDECGPTSSPEQSLTSKAAEGVPQLAGHERSKLIGRAQFSTSIIEEHLVHSEGPRVYNRLLAIKNGNPNFIQSWEYQGRPTCHCLQTKSSSSSATI
jgi:hypothetical protein